MSGPQEAGRRVALVTGATYGVGAAAAGALARDGFDVAVTEHRGGNLGATVAAVEAAGRRALPLTLDLRDQASIEAVVARTVAEFGGIDVLVNNAAAIVRRKAVEVTREDWAAVFDTNVTGTYFVTQQVGRHMIATGRRGVVVSITSVHGIVGFAEQSIYGISKAAVNHMTRMLAVEWAPHGITVNAVAPGRLLTESPPRAAATRDPAHIAFMQSQIPLGRFATVEEVAGAVAYFAGPRSGSVTGQVLAVDGGLTVA